MFYNLHQHREATCLRQKEAWEETINKRLSKCEEDIDSIPIVIWGLEASPSFFDFNNEASEPLKNRIRTLDLLHENYLYNESAKDGKNYGVRIIKNWINKKYAPDTPKKKPSEYSYGSLITQLSGTDCPERYFTEVEPALRNPIHLVYDIFPEWHGLPVPQVARDLCYNESYMCSKVDDFVQHVESIQSAFSECNDKVKPGDIHFVWLGTKQTNERFPKQQACHQFFCCLKKLPGIEFWYNPGGFVTKKGLKKWAIDCPGDFVAIGVPADWSKHIVQAGYHTVEALRNEQPTAVFQKLKGFREEENLDISILKLDQVESWFHD